MKDKDTVTILDPSPALWRAMGCPPIEGENVYGKTRLTAEVSREVWDSVESRLNVGYRPGCLYQFGNTHLKDEAPEHELKGLGIKIPDLPFDQYSGWNPSFALYELPERDYLRVIFSRKARKRMKREKNKKEKNQRKNWAAKRRRNLLWRFRNEKKKMRYIHPSYEGWIKIGDLI